MTHQQGLTYPIDIVLCIDGTGSMGGIIQNAKAQAIKFHDDLRHAMEKKQKSIERLRVKLIVFRDYYVDGDMSMTQTPFFELPSQQDEFAEFVRTIEATGGGPEPESGLEALALAIKSDWTTEGAKKRHVIVLWTDAPPHPLEENAESKPSNYPPDMPKDFDELTDIWEGDSYTNLSAKRLVLFAPDTKYWSEIGPHWNNAVHYTSEAGKGLAEMDYKTILGLVADSV